MRYLIIILFLVPGIFNFIPVVGVISNQQLSRLYQVSSLSVDLALLLRHRALLFGIVGGYMIYAAFQESLRNHAAVMGLVSMVSFIVLVFMLKTSNPSLVRLAYIDAVLTLMLLSGYVLHLRYP